LPPPAMETFTAASHDDVLRLVVQVALLLFAARTMGEVARRFGHPSVVGEILAGILLGPSLLSSVAPMVGGFIVPQTPVQGYLLEVVAMIGAMFLMLITGIETDLALIRRHFRTAIGVSVTGMTFTFLAGFALGMTLPDFVLGNPRERTVFAVFLGVALSISAIAVIAKVVMELNLMRRDIGQTIIAAGMSDDTIGWILLSIVVGLASGHLVSIATITATAGSVILFIGFSLTAGRWLVKWLINFVHSGGTGLDRYLTLIVVLMFTWGAIASSLGFEAVLGAFVIGIVIGQVRGIPDEVFGRLESLSMAIFTPIFFAVAGLKVNLLHLMRLDLVLLALVVLVSVTTAKGLGTYLGARVVGGKSHWTGLAFSASLNTRGAMDIIVATIGLSIGVLSQDMFSIIVLMAISTALVMPRVLRAVLAHVEPSDEELARLEQEELAAGSFVANIHRVLLPIRLRDATHATYSIEASILERMESASPIALTLLTITRPGERAKGIEFLDKVSALFPQKDLTKKVAEATAPSEIILDEAAKGYDLLVLGASQDSNSRVLFNPMVDYLLRVSPCPTMVVRSSADISRWKPSRVLVPTNGSRSGKIAAEVAFALAQSETDRLTMMNVVVQAPHASGLDIDGNVFQRQLGNARQMVDELRSLAAKHGVTADAEVKVGQDPETVILETARTESSDLIILGTNLRIGTQRLFLGPRVERILNNAPCPVIVINIP
jgi:Kef-type K+ transport system membrane component KefB